MTEQTYILGLDVGGTKTAVVLGDRAGQVHESEQFETEPERGCKAALADLQGLPGEGDGRLGHGAMQSFLFHASPSSPARYPTFKTFSTEQSLY